MSFADDFDSKVQASPVSTFLRDLSARLLRIADKLERGTAKLEPSAPAKADRRLLPSLAIAEYGARRRREEFIPTSLLGEPAWDILLHLFIQHGQGQLASVGSACEASAVYEISARRWLDALERAALIETGPAIRDRDARRVRLTDQGYLAVSNCLLGRAGILA